MKIKFILNENNFDFFKKWENFFNSVLTRENYSIDLAEKRFKYLGAGSFRRVYAFPNDEPYVLKIAKSPKSNIMNMRETSPHVQTKYSLILPKMYIRADDYSWIVVERVSAASSDNLPEFGNFFNFQNFLFDVTTYTMEMDLRFAVQKAMKISKLKKLSPTLNQIINFITEYDIAIYDLREANFGVAEDGRLVILDASFADDLDSALRRDE